MISAMVIYVCMDMMVEQRNARPTCRPDYSPSPVEWNGKDCLLERVKNERLTICHAIKFALEDHLNVFPMI